MVGCAPVEFRWPKYNEIRNDTRHVSEGTLKVYVDVIGTTAVSASTAMAHLSEAQDLAERHVASFYPPGCLAAHGAA